MKGYWNEMHLPDEMNRGCGLKKHDTVEIILRDSEILHNPHGEMHLCAIDVLFVLGPPRKIAGAMSLFHNLEEREAS